MTTMPAISIRQPWAWAILSAGKNVENRSWPTNHRGPVLIQASQWSRPREMLTDLAKAIATAYVDTARIIAMPTGFGIDNLKPQCGGIVGIVTIKDCVQNYPSPWAMDDHWHWVLADARPLPFWPCKGRLGIWRVDYPHSLAA